MWKCTKCETLNKNEHHSCFICHDAYVTEPPPPPPPPWWKLLLIAALAVGLIFALVFASTNVLPDPPEPEMVTVPDVVGLSLGDARQSLRELGLEIHTRVEHDPSVAEGIVISQNIEEDTPVERGERIELTISRGPEMVTVPDLVGLSLADAERSLEEMGLRVRTSDEYHSEIAEGVVISQNKREGTEVELETRIELTISRGPEMVTVSDVTGMSLTSARRQLEENGLMVQVNRVYHPTILRNNVINQEPSANTSREQGTRIYLTISQGPDPNKLPFDYDAEGFETIQIVSRGVTIDVPIPLEWDLIEESGTSYRFYRGFRWFGVGGDIGQFDSVEERMEEVLYSYRNRRYNVRFEIRENTSLEGSRLLVLERERVLGQSATINEEHLNHRREAVILSYVMIFEYQEEVVYVILYFDETSPREEKERLFRVYGFGKFIEAGYL